MKLENPRFGDKNILTLIQDENTFSKDYFLSNGASFSLTVEFMERKQSYSIELINLKGNIKDFCFYDNPENVIICKERDYKFECMVLSNFGTSLKSNIRLNFIVFFDLKLKPNSSNSAHNVLFKHGIFRSLAFDEYIEFYIRQASGKEKLHCIIRKVFVSNDSKASSYFIYFNWGNKKCEKENSEIKVTATEKFMILAKEPMNEMEMACLKMLEDAIIQTPIRKASASF
uniref:Uncharacterized protein n=1 Tax=Panagrolaimus superbus TaxID=310955 RepID=A0A914YGU7_9BILA